MVAEMTPKTRRSSARRAPSLRLAEHLTCGLCCGVPAGLLMAVFVPLASGVEPAALLHAAASFVLPVRAPTAVGAAAHLVLASAWGALFSWLVRPGTDASRTVAWGTLFGVAVFLVTQGLLPRIAPSYVGVPGQALWPLFVGHLIYGGSLALLVALWRSRRTWRGAHWGPPVTRGAR